MRATRRDQRRTCSAFLPPRLDPPHLHCLGKGFTRRPAPAVEWTRWGQKRRLQMDDCSSDQNTLPRGLARTLWTVASHPNKCGHPSDHPAVRGWPTAWCTTRGGRDVLEGGGVGWDPPPSSQGPPMVPAEGGPRILKRKSSWHRRRRSKTLAVTLKHRKGRRGGGSRGGGGTPSSCGVRPFSCITGGGVPAGPGGRAEGHPDASVWPPSCSTDNLRGMLQGNRSFPPAGGRGSRRIHLPGQGARRHLPAKKCPASGAWPQTGN